VIEENCKDKKIELQFDGIKKMKEEEEDDDG
jgi:hypothetical protein